MVPPIASATTTPHHGLSSSQETIPALIEPHRIATVVDREPRGTTVSPDFNFGVSILLTTKRVLTCLISIVFGLAVSR